MFSVILLRSKLSIFWSNLVGLLNTCFCGFKIIYTSNRIAFAFLRSNTKEYRGPLLPELFVAKVFKLFQCANFIFMRRSTKFYIDVFQLSHYWVHNSVILSCQVI